MSEYQNLSSSDTGMCSHGNLSNNCSICDKEETQKQTEDKVKEILKSFTTDGCVMLRNAPEEVLSNRQVILEAVKNNGYNLRFASPELCADKQIVMEAVKNYGFALGFASPELQIDENIIKEALKEVEVNEESDKLIAFLMKKTYKEYDEKEMMEEQKSKKDKISNLIKDIHRCLVASEKNPSVLYYEAERISDNIIRDIPESVDRNSPAAEAQQLATIIWTSGEYKNDFQKAQAAMTDLKEMLINLL